ncbi:MAG: amidohydrolase [bacterium]
MRILLPFIGLFLLTMDTLYSQSADLAFVNGKIWTVDKSKQIVQAVAVSGDRIVAIGTTAQIKAFIGKGTKVVDLKGKLMLPGVIDDHTHFIEGSFQLSYVDLRKTKTLAEFSSIIEKRAKQSPTQWILGGDWDHENWAGANLPTKEAIDKVTPSTPMFVKRYDWHMALVNSYVLKIAGITKDTPNPPGGTIVKDPATGEPTGILKDEAMSFVYKLIPDPTEKEMIEAVKLGLAEARKFGVTSINDVSSAADVRVYQALKAEGALTARFHCRLPLSQWQHVAATGIKVPFGDEWIRLGSMKDFVDGSVGSTTALFFAPYDSDPSTSGLTMDGFTNGNLEKWALAADRANLQLSIHAIGDKANSDLLDIFENIVKANPAWDRRFRIEHAQHIHPKDFARFVKLGVIASVQPYHAIDDGRWVIKRIGSERCKTTYPFKTFIEQGVKICFGSDWTVAPLNPLLGIYAAVTRRTTDGANPNGWYPEQKISVEQAIECYTINNAYAQFEENEKGSITVGKLADLVVLSDDILTIDPIKIETARIEMTVVGGKVVFEK